MNTIILTTSNNIEGRTIQKYIDVINSNIVVGNNLIAEAFASFSDVFGGRSGKYQNKLNDIYKYAKTELINKAKEMDADAIIGLKMDFGEVSGKGKDMFMVSAIGTAVKLNRIEDKKDASDKENMSAAPKYQEGQPVIIKATGFRFTINKVINEEGAFKYYSEKFHTYFNEDDITDDITPIFLTDKL